MTTQRQVIDAFLNGENSPSVASNLRLFSDGYEAALVSAEAHVLAHRQPLRNFRIWTGFIDFRPTESSISAGYIRDQQWEVRYALRDSVIEDEPTVERISSAPPEPSDFEVVDQ
jgi:hypothetical protein